MRAEDIRKVRNLGQERLAKIVDAAELGICAREDRRMRGGGERNVRVSTREYCALGSKGVEVRCEVEFGAQEAHSVGARGVQSDENDVRRSRKRRRFGGGSRNEEKGTEQDGASCSSPH